MAAILLEQAVAKLGDLLPGEVMPAGLIEQATHLFSAIFPPKP